MGTVSPKAQVRPPYSAAYQGATHRRGPFDSMWVESVPGSEVAIPFAAPHSVDDRLAPVHAGNGGVLVVGAHLLELVRRRLENAGVHPRHGRGKGLALVPLLPTEIDDPFERHRRRERAGGRLDYNRNKVVAAYTGGSR